jgi:hypothetical protein
MHRVDLRKQCVIGNDNEFPRLLISGRRRSHCGPKDMFDVLVGYGIASIGTDTAAVDNF